LAFFWLTCFDCVNTSKIPTCDITLPQFDASYAGKCLEAPGPAIFRDWLTAA
jgi:hypothetical protein